MNMHGFQSRVIVVVVVIAFTISGCAQDPQRLGSSVGVTDSTILLGSSNALSGHASFLGSQYNRGSSAFFKEINESGGVFGRKIRVISYDDQYDPPQTVANTAKLINEDNVFMLFNYVGTPTSVQIMDKVQEAAIPAFGFLTGAETLRTPFRPFMFHLRASYYSEIEGVISYFVDTLGFDKIAVMYQDDAFGMAVLSGVQLALNRRNLEIIATDTYVRGTMDVEHAVQSVSESAADAVIMVGTYSPLAKFIKLSHKADYAPYFHTVSFIGSEAFAKEIIDIDVDPSTYDQIIVTQVVPSPYEQELAGIVEYRRVLEKHYPQDEPNYVSLEGFLNAKVLAEALFKNGPVLTRETLGRTIESMDSVDVGIGKTISFGARDHMGLEDIYYSRLSSEGTFSVFTYRD